MKKINGTFMRILVLSSLIFFVSCDNNTQHSPDTSDTVRPQDASSDANKDVDTGRDLGQDPASSPDSSIDVSAAPDVPDFGPTLSNALSQHEISLQFGDLESTLALPNISNALPFLSASFNLGHPVLRHIHLDVLVENDLLRVSRTADPPMEGEEVRVSGNVVAFDPGRMKVACSTFRTANVDVLVPIPLIDPTRSFINFWYKVNTGSNNKDIAFVSTFFKTPELLHFERKGPAGIISGHFCVVESQDQSFQVQHLLSSMNVGEKIVRIPITTIKPSSSLLFLSHQATRLQSSPGYSQIACELRAAEVICHRSLSENEITDIHIQVVEFSGRTRVLHRRIEIPDGVLEVRLEAPQIHRTDSVIFGPVSVLGEVATDGDSKIKVPGSFVDATPMDGAIVFRRGSPEIGNLLFFPQIVRW